MIKDRWLEADDLPLLSLSLAKDEHHKTTEPEFFTQSGCVTKVYEDEQGPMMFVRGTKALRLDIQFMENNDVRRNVKALRYLGEQLPKLAKENGFTELIFNTNSPLLAKLCTKHFGFVESQGELRRFL